MRKKLLLFGFLLTTFVSANGQDVGEMTVDELYKKARTTAFDNGNYDRAREFAYTALDRSPNYHEIRIFVARTFSWDGNYPKARKELQYVLDEDRDNRAAYLALIDVESWSGNYEKALDLANRGLEHYPKDEALLLEKAAAQLYMEDYKLSEKTYKEILDQYPNSKKARDGLRSVQLKQRKYAATLSYRNDQFVDIFEPWSFWEFGLRRQTPIGSIIGRVQYARRFATDGTQFNLDAYPSITDGLYAYVSGGYSNSSVYPKYRFGFSLYKSLPSSFELEGGIRYLDFTTSQTDIYTLSLTKYWGSYLFTLRTYFIPSPGGNSASLGLVSRRYFGNADTYLSLNSGYGSATSQIQFAQDTRTLDSWSVSIDGQYPLSDVFLIGGNAGYDSAEFLNFARKRFSFKTYITYQF